jgi:hypothetical protein
MERCLDRLAVRRAPRTRILSVIERLDLGPKQSLWIVAYGQRHFLVTGGAETMGGAIEVGPAVGGGRDRIPVLTPARWMEE